MEMLKQSRLQYLAFVIFTNPLWLLEFLRLREVTTDLKTASHEVCRIFPLRLSAPRFCHRH